MLQHYDKARLERAAQEAGMTDVDSVVLAIMKDNGQVVIHNIGDTDGRKVLLRHHGGSLRKRYVRDERSIHDACERR